MIATPSVISTLSYFCGGYQLGRTKIISSDGSKGWPTANDALYIPLWLPFPYLVKRVFWGNGTSPTGNMDFAILTWSGSRIYSTGSTAQSGSSVPQYVSTDLVLSPGRYYIGLANNGTTNRVWGVATTVQQETCVRSWQQASAFAIPATATFAAYTALIRPLCGITRVA